MKITTLSLATVIIVGIVGFLSYYPKYFIIPTSFTHKINIGDKTMPASQPVDYNQLKIKSYTHWDLYLHENQCYLGRVFVQLKDDAGVEDFLAIKGDERDEFFAVGAAVKKALKTLFNPDKMNYAALSNSSERIHVHMVPRYKEIREFAGVEFDDLRWGKNYAPYDRSFVLEPATLYTIRDAIKAEL